MALPLCHPPLTPVPRRSRCAWQHEMANHAYARQLDVDWHLPMVFCVGKRPHEVPLRIDTRTTRDREEGAPEHNPNEVYHVSLNLTHVHRVN